MFWRQQIPGPLGWGSFSGGVRKEEVVSTADTMIQRMCLEAPQDAAGPTARRVPKGWVVHFKQDFVRAP